VWLVAASVLLHAVKVEAGLGYDCGLFIIYLLRMAGQALVVSQQLPNEHTASNHTTPDGKQSLYSKRIAIIRANILSLSSRVSLVMITLTAYIIGGRIVNSRSPVVALGVVLAVYLAVVLVEMLITEEMALVQATLVSDADSTEEKEPVPAADVNRAVQGYSFGGGGSRDFRPTTSPESTIRQYQLNLVGTIKIFAENLFGVVITILVDTNMLSSTLNIIDALVILMLIAIITAIETVLTPPQPPLSSAT